MAVALGASGESPARLATLRPPALPDDPLRERSAVATPHPSFGPIRADLRPRCLYDHLARFIDLARAAGVALTIDGVDAVARQLDPASV
jgi:hypothetical protein